MTRVCAFLLMLALCASLLCGCETWNNFKKRFIDPPEPDKHVVKIGVFEPLTGRQSYDAEEEIRGIELAHEYCSNILGMDVELVYADNRSSTDVAPEAVRNLADAGCAAILGSVSDTLSLAASDVIRETMIPAVAITNSVPILTQTNTYYFRASYINTFDTEGAAMYIFDELQEPHCAVLTIGDNDYANGKADAFIQFFLEICGSETCEYQVPADPGPGRGGEDTPQDMITLTGPSILRLTLPADAEEADIRAIEERLQQEHIRTIYCPCAPQLVLPLMEKAHSEGKDICWIGADSWADIDSIAAESYVGLGFLTGISYTLDYDAANGYTETAKTFSKLYHEKYGAESTLTKAAALGFDAYMMVMQGIRNSINAFNTPEFAEETGKKFEDIRDWSPYLFSSDGKFKTYLLTQGIYAITDMEGVTGNITINSAGDPIKDIVIKQFNGTEFTVVYTAIPNRGEQKGEE